MLFIRNTLIILLSLLNYLFSFTTTAQPSISQKVQAYEQLLKKLVENRKLPSVSFAILKDQKIIYSNAIGFADFNKKIPATDTTLYSIASLTKPIASAIIFQLVEKRVLQLDDKMKSHWPDYEQYYSSFAKKWKEETPQYLPYIRDYQFLRNDITVRHHLSHTAEGIPGTHYRYNGFLFGGLSKVVDKVSVKNFATLLQEEIVDKLKMKYSSIDLDHIKNSDQQNLLSTPYLEEENALVPSKYPEPHTISAAAGFISCVKDLAKFDIALDRNELISGGSKELAMTPYQLPDGKVSPYGLGWFITTVYGHKIIYHYGLQESFSAIYLKIPVQNLTLILLCNSRQLTMPFSKDLAEGIVDTNPFVDQFLKIFL